MENATGPFMTATPTRRLFLGRLVLAGGGAVVLASALALTVPGAQAGKPMVFTGIVDGTGAGGFDVVAYFTAGKPVRGDAAIAHSWNGATWRFSTVENRDAFAANPARYAPQFGGYCAWAVSEGYTAKGDPKHWKVVNGKLYLNYNGRIQRRWEKDIPGHISKGNANWPNVLGG